MSGGRPVRPDQRGNPADPSRTSPFSLAPARRTATFRPDRPTVPHTNPSRQRSRATVQPPVQTTDATAGLTHPVAIDASDTRARTTPVIRAVIPCYNRPQDLEILFRDLEALDLAGIDLGAIVVDNGSDPPLANLTLPTDPRTRLHDSGANLGGSGGYNAGMNQALAWSATTGADPDYVWLIDSDARVKPDTLRKLLDVMEADETVVMAGAAIADPEHERVFEVGGFVYRGFGGYAAKARGVAGIDTPIDCEYVAACCALVRADALRIGGLMPDVFLNGDDVEWCIRLTQATGGRIVAVPDAIAIHPMFDKFQTWARYYHARNAFGAMDALRLGRRVRFKRALIEGARAIQQTVAGRPDLARLHIRGIADAADRDALGMAPAGTIKVEPFQPWSELPQVLDELRPKGPIAIFERLWMHDSHRTAVESLLDERGIAMAEIPNDDTPSMLTRWWRSHRFDLAILPARMRPDMWFHARKHILAADGGFLVRDSKPVPNLIVAGFVACKAIYYSTRLALRRRETRTAVSRPDPSASPAVPTLETIVLSHNRLEMLTSTLDTLRRSDPVARGRLTVVDNGSEDGTPATLKRDHPEVTLVELTHNAGVDAFNRAVSRSQADLVLILDDDAWPEPESLQQAIELMGRRPDLGAVTFKPVHPTTKRSEWPFAKHAPDGTDRWPVMGCANLVRRDVWERVGGYEPGFFLYRNDTDLALKILGANRGVWFQPDWVAWHDSPSAARKSVRWHHLATRNWCWLARRHGRPMAALKGILLGTLWTAKSAGFSPKRHLATLRGLADGLLKRPPPTEFSAPDDFAEFVATRTRRTR